MPELKQKTMFVDVAKATVKGKTELVLAKVAPVVLRPGQTLEIRYNYELDESSKEKEQWIFTMSSKVAAVSAEISPLVAEPLTVQWGDRWGLPDSAAGAMQQKYNIPKPGEYKADFEVGAEYVKVAWGSHVVDQREQKKAKGTFQIRVLPR